MATRNKNTEIRYAPAKRFSVKQVNIDTGKPRCTTACAVAQAIAETGATRALVHRGKVSFTIGGWRYHFDVTPPLAAYIKQYDGPNGKLVTKPATFTLRNGFAMPAGRQGTPDKTEHARHNRPARKGFTGRRKGLVPTKDRLDGMIVYKTESFGKL